MVSIFIFTFVSKNHALGKQDSYLVRAAVFFALAADYFLVVNEIFPLGISLFCICQLLHFFRYTGLKTLIKCIIPLPFVYLVLSFIIADTVTRMSIIYIICLALASTGAVLAFKSRKYDSPNRHFIVTAMIFFIISDINVLLYNTPPLIDYRLYFLYFIWSFVLPAHILLSLSKIKLR